MNFTNDIRQNLKKKETTVAVKVNLDIEKAFDIAWLMGLLYKLVKFLHSYLIERKFHVAVNGIVFEEINVFQGVPQGSVLGSIFFTFADDTTLKGSCYLLLCGIEELRLGGSMRRAF